MKAVFCPKDNCFWIKIFIFCHSLPQRKSISPKLTPLQRSQSCEALDKPVKPPTPPQSACGHPNAGQELCYLCHQRSRRNIPVSFTEERRRREAEEDKLLQQYQYMKDAEDTLKDQVFLLLGHKSNHQIKNSDVSSDKVDCQAYLLSMIRLNRPLYRINRELESISCSFNRIKYLYIDDPEIKFLTLWQEGMLVKRHDLQKMAAFNLGVAEAVTHKKKSRDMDFHVSWIEIYCLKKMK